MSQKPLPPRIELFYKTEEQLQALASFLARDAASFSGVLFTNKGKDDNLARDAQQFLKYWEKQVSSSSPQKYKLDVDVCAVFAIKAQWSGAGDDTYKKWCKFYKAAAYGNLSRVLLVTGNPKKPLDSIGFLKRFAPTIKEERSKCRNRPRIGVAFSPYILDESTRMEERARLTTKLSTGIVDDVWLQFGGDAKRLKQELNWLSQTHGKGDGKKEFDFELHGSMFVPSPQWVAQFRFRPWNGIVLPEGFLKTLDTALDGCKDILKIYREYNVRVLIESQTKQSKDLARIAEFLNQPEILAAKAEVDMEGDSPSYKRQKRS